MDISIDKARFNMVQQQIRPWNVMDDEVLSVMAELPREQFVPAAYRNLAYADLEVPIGEGQSMLAPKVVAHMLQALAIRPQDKILQIGTGTGYVTACLCRLGGHLVGMEIHAELAERTRTGLQGLKPRRLEVRVGDGLAGPVEEQPFDVIAVTGSLPDAAALGILEDQLAPGGRLFAVVGEEPVMEALLVTRATERDFHRRSLLETCVPALEKAPRPERFVF
ncbi:MAG: protein-L-isoaspartate O-methyltransferase [Candidatus Thiosymbion ectosymbiont of Robbea hypermnestra]|nr:protein-L-isoaspartate O-methyltransferase [Candidatus Thiosymbion ectosymbiont of Robbea hypermnestra]